MVFITAERIFWIGTDYELIVFLGLELVLSSSLLISTFLSVPPICSFVQLCACIATKLYAVLLLFLYYFKQTLGRIDVF